MPKSENNRIKNLGANESKNPVEFQNKAVQKGALILDNFYLFVFDFQWIRKVVFVGMFQTTKANEN